MSATVDYGRTPVLLVHGHGMSSGTWRPMIRYLVSLGYPIEYLHAVDIMPNTMANVEAATKVLEPAATLLLERAKAAARNAGYQGGVSQRVDIVAHSMGAVSSRWYAAKLHPELVRTWISIAGSNHGTDVLCGYHDEAAREMCPAFAADSTTNPVQVSLNGTAAAPLDETPYGLGADRDVVAPVPPDEARRILYFTIRLESDEWIKPERSAILDGAGGAAVRVSSVLPAVETRPGNFLLRAPMRHDPLLEHPDLMRLVASLLAGSH